MRTLKVLKDHDSDVPEDEYDDDSGNEVADPDSDFELVCMHVYIFVSVSMYVRVCIM